MSTDDNFLAAKKNETEEWTEVEVEALMSAMPTDDPSIPLTQEACESTHSRTRARTSLIQEDEGSFSRRKGETGR